MVNNSEVVRDLLLADMGIGLVWNYAVDREIADGRLMSGRTEDHELPDQDIQWTRIVELELVPHPANVQHPDAIEADYGMSDGVLRLKARAALAGYVL